MDLSALEAALSGLLNTAGGALPPPPPPPDIPDGEDNGFGLDIVVLGGSRPRTDAVN